MSAPRGGTAGAVGWPGRRRGSRLVPRGTPPTRSPPERVLRPANRAAAPLWGGWSSRDPRGTRPPRSAGQTPRALGGSNAPAPRASVPVSVANAGSAGALHPLACAGCPARRAAAVRVAARQQRRSLRCHAPSCAGPRRAPNPCRSFRRLSHLYGCVISASLPHLGPQDPLRRRPRLKPLGRAPVLPIGHRLSVRHLNLVKGGRRAVVRTPLRRSSS